MDLRLSEHEVMRGRELLEGVLGQGPRGTGVLVVFANATGKKRFPPVWWGRFMQEFHRKAPNALVIELLPDSGISFLNNVYPCMYSTDLRKMASIIAASDAFVSADCGVMHLAAATPTPTVGIFSVTLPSRYGPLGDGDFSLCRVDPEQAAQAVAEDIERLGSVAVRYN